MKNHTRIGCLSTMNRFCALKSKLKKVIHIVNAKTSHGSNIFQADMVHISTDAYLTMGSIYVDLVQEFLKKNE